MMLFLILLDGFLSNILNFMSSKNSIDHRDKDIKCRGSYHIKGRIFRITILLKVGFLG